MSSNITLDRVCEHCKQLFTARTTKTRYCSHTCNQKAYRVQQKKENIRRSNLESSKTIILNHSLSSPETQDQSNVWNQVQQEHQTNIPEQTNESPPTTHQRETITIKELILILGVSERTLYRLLKTEGFPKLKVRRRVLFNKQTVIDFITTKYQADEGDIKKEEIEKR